MYHNTASKSIFKRRKSHHFIIFNLFIAVGSISELFKHLYHRVVVLGESLDSKLGLSLIVGKSEGAHYDNLKDCSNVYIVNEVVSDLDFDAYLRLASAVVLPYRRIYQSGFLFTALQRGVPVIVSNVGGLPEPLKLAKVGWNIGETSVDNLKKALETIVQAPDSLFAIKNDREAFETVRKEYSWDKIGQQTSELYTRVLS